MLTRTGTDSWTPQRVWLDLKRGVVDHCNRYDYHRRRRFVGRSARVSHRPGGNLSFSSSLDLHPSLLPTFFTDQFSSFHHQKSSKIIKTITKSPSTTSSCLAGMILALSTQVCLMYHVFQPTLPLSKPFETVIIPSLVLPLERLNVICVMFLPPRSKHPSNVNYAGDALLHSPETNPLSCCRLRRDYCYHFPIMLLRRGD